VCSAKYGWRHRGRLYRVWKQLEFGRKWQQLRGELGRQLKRKRLRKQLRQPDHEQLGRRLGDGLVKQRGYERFQQRLHQFFFE
jgi:hypothetical protein